MGKFKATTNSEIDAEIEQDMRNEKLETDARIEGMALTEREKERIKEQMELD